jgi:hypothetical protein
MNLKATSALRAGLPPWARDFPALHQRRGCSADKPRAHDSQARNPRTIGWISFAYTYRRQSQPKNWDSNSNHDPIRPHQAILQPQRPSPAAKPYRRRVRPVAAPAPTPGRESRIPPPAPDWPLHPGFRLPRGTAGHRAGWRAARRTAGPGPNDLAGGARISRAALLEHSGARIPNASSK